MERLKKALMKMSKKTLTAVIAVLVTSCLLPASSDALYTPPASFGPPKNVSVKYHASQNISDWNGFDITADASDELRAFVDVVDAENSLFKSAGYSLTDILMQIDYKVDNGEWRYKMQWDEDLERNTNKSPINIKKGTYSNISVFTKSQFESISDENKLPDKKAFFNEHTMYIKVRFIIRYKDNSGIYYSYASPWSQLAAFSGSQPESDDIADNSIDSAYALGSIIYSYASAWAKPELDKAAEYDLIPFSLNGTDMTKYITREEFAQIAVRLYEKSTGTTASAVSPNPFTDTENTEILKAYNLKITYGTSYSKFSPQNVINREQAASMLSRTIRLISPEEDYPLEDAPTFTDEDDISPWALEDVLFMSGIGIIKGAGGKFMPKAATPALAAEGYGNTTCEQAIAMSLRIFNRHNK